MAARKSRNVVYTFAAKVDSVSDLVSKLSTGTTVYARTARNADGTPMRARITSVKTWKRDANRIEIGYKHGMYDYGKFTSLADFNAHVALSYDESEQA